MKRNVGVAILIIIPLMAFLALTYVSLGNLTDDIKWIATIGIMAIMGIGIWLGNRIINDD
jgi:hypothetical protein